MSYWYSDYTVDLDPPKKCSKCSISLTTFLSEDRENIKMMIVSQPEKLKTLKSFLASSRNKEFSYKVLDDEIRRVLT